MKNVLFIAFLLLQTKTIFAQCNGAGGVPRFCLAFVNQSITNGGTKFEADIVVSGSVPFGLGSSNIQWNFNTTGLGSPVLLTHNLPINYAAPTVTVPSTGLASLNIVLNVPGSGLTIATSGTTVARVQFNILVPAQSSGFVWFYDDILERTIVYEHSETNILCATANNTTCLVPLNASLPLDLTAFEAWPGNRRINLTWATENEFNLRGFDLERSDDLSGNFQKIAFLGANGGQFAQKYSYPDRLVEFGKTYQYRLRMVDLDGKTQFSPVRTARLENAEGQAPQLFPNPTTGDFTISGTENWERATVRNALGQAVREFVFSEKTTLAGLGAGIYFIEIYGEKGDAPTVLRAVKN